MTASVFDAEIRALPSGSTGLPRDLVAASQRQRLVHGVTMCVAEKGLPATTIADVTARAGVSKKTFYEHFDDKLACFVAAYDHGSAAILAAVEAASRAAARDGADAIGQLRAGTRAYLAFLVDEAPYARTFTLEVLAAGPEAVARHRACREAFARSVASWHAAHARGRGWPAASAFAFEVATGLVYEASSARVATGRLDELPGLEDELVAAQLAVLGVPVRPARRRTPR